MIIVEMECIAGVEGAHLHICYAEMVSCHFRQNDSLTGKAARR